MQDSWRPRLWPSCLHPLPSCCYCCGTPLTPQAELADLDDAAAELMLADDDERVRMRVGGCFWEVDKDAAEARIESLTGRYAVCMWSILCGLYVVCIMWSAWGSTSEVCSVCTI